MKKIILMGIIILSLTGCTVTAKPDNITKSIMDKYNIQYLNEDKKAKQWLGNSVTNNFFIHIEIDKKGKYEQIKEAILHTYDRAYNKANKRRKAELYIKSNTRSYGMNIEYQKACLSELEARKALYIEIGQRDNKTDNDIYRECMKLSPHEISSNYNKTILQQMFKGIDNVQTFNIENISYSVIKHRQINFNAFGLLIYKYGFIEPINSDKAYFYTNFSLDYKGNIYMNLHKRQRELDKDLIKKTLTLLKSNQIPYQYLSEEYSLVDGKSRVSYDEIAFTDLKNSSSIKEISTPKKYSNQSLSKSSSYQKNTTDKSVQAPNVVKACMGCHGANFEKRALGKSKIVKNMSRANIITALKGYKNGSYGGTMKSLMFGQVQRLKNKDMDDIANYIISL